MLQEFNPKNKDLQVWVADQLFHRSEAKVSVFDSSVQAGDLVWEGLRLYADGVLHLDEHLDRLYASAHALDFKGVPEREVITSALSQTFKANGMTRDAHVRLSLSRGEKITSGMDPRLNQKGCTLIVLAEWKAPVYDQERGIKVVTTHIRRNGPQYLDSKIHHGNLLNNILAKIQANLASADAGVMLDDRGFVAELNDTNLFMIKEGVLFTPHATACLPGISRSFVMELADENDIPVLETDLSITEFYNADAVFCTGTMGELCPIHEIDGRAVPKAHQNETFTTLLDSYRAGIPARCTNLLG